MQQLNNQPQREEGVGRRPMSGNSNKQRRALGPMQQLNNHLKYGNKRDGSSRQQRERVKEIQ
jgi:hypothetical protein